MRNITKRYTNSFFPYCQSHWSKLTPAIKNSSTFAKFRTNLLKTIRPERSKLYGITDKYGLKYLSQLHVKFNDLRASCFRHSFNCLSPMCLCHHDNETNVHFLLKCNRFTRQRAAYFDDIKNIPGGSQILSLSPNSLENILLYGSDLLDDASNKKILELTISFVKNTKRFEK